ncbi:MAG: nuclear transport factor 2 family protein [Gammaproteobacteria bacterium]|nr:nuclear transport factor 2 family protein [Gammaproteobacteria bacterium]
MSTAAEQANEEIVSQFCQAWANRDAELLTTFFAQPFEYMVWEGGPVITTNEEFVRQMGPFLKSLKSVDWVVVRSHAMGPMVVNERIDHFYAHDPKHDHHPHIAGMFIVRNGKISVWRDYSMPKPGQA